MTKSPLLSPNATPLMTVSEEPAPLFLPGGMLPSISSMSASGYQVYMQSPWTAPMGMSSYMAGASGAYPGLSPTLSATSSWGYPTYPMSAPYGSVTSGSGSATLPAQACSSTMSVVQSQAVPINLAASTSRGQAGRASAQQWSTGDYAAARFERCQGTESTTVMLRNIPNRYTQGHLIDLLDENGFRSRYDFVYLPMDFRNGVNLGYAFVNLLNHQDALHAMGIFQGFSRWYYESTKVCEVSWAHPHQGLEEHVERYRNSPVMHACMPDEYKPMLFRDGIRIPFPPPTKAIRAPKLRPVRDRESRDQAMMA